MENGAAGLQVRKWFEIVEESCANESWHPADGAPLKKFVIAAVVANPYAGVYSEDLSKLTQPSIKLGSVFGDRLVAASRGEHIESYGKACIVGVNGEYEHGNACLTSAFADPIRDALRGAKAWIPSTGKRGGPGTSIDVPLAHKDALYVRSHYDTVTVAFADAPGPDEILVIFAAANRGRLHARLGGLEAGAIQGVDGLR